MKVPFLDLRIIDSQEKHRLLKSIETVFDHGKMVMGPEIDQFEQKTAQFCERKYAISVGSGTSALYLGLRALDIGVGDEVITTSLSWIATANAIALTGAIPVFADINNDLNIDPKSVESLITKKTKAILAVNYTGRICDMEAFEQIAKTYNLFLIEDGSQSFGALLNDRMCGSFGDLSAISHNPMKVFAAVGEAGSILCNSDELKDKLVSLRYNGTVNRETCIEPSLNGRMDTLQAAVLLERFKTLDKVIYSRRKNAKFFNESLSKYVVTPTVSADRNDVYYTYTIRSAKRDKLKLFLESNGIETKIQHPLLMPQQPAYSKNAKGVFTNAEELVKQVLCIPIHEKLNESQCQYIADTIIKFGISKP